MHKKFNKIKIKTLITKSNSFDLSYKIIAFGVRVFYNYGKNIVV